MTKNERNAGRKKKYICDIVVTTVPKLALPEVKELIKKYLVKR